MSDYEDYDNLFFKPTKWQRFKEWYKDNYCQILLVVMFADLIGIAFGYKICKLILWCWFYWEIAKMISEGKYDVSHK